MSAFNYLISVTGDCSHTSAGAISILPSGGTAPYTVQWVNPNLGSDLVTTQPSLKQNLYYGTYAIRLNDSTLPVNNSFYVNIPVSSGVCANILSVQSTTCGLNNGSVTGTSTSQYSSTNFILYSSDTTFIQSATTNLQNVVFNNLSAGTYYLVAKDIGGCSGKTSSFIIEDSTPLSFGLYNIPDSSCSNMPMGKLFVTGQTGTPPYTYLWSNLATTDSITGLTSGNYSVVVTDAFGCTATQSAKIEKVSVVGIGLFTVTNPTCFSNNGAINLQVTGGTAPFYYSASTGDVLVSYSRNYGLSGLSSGSYQFLVTDAGLCTASSGTTLQTPSGIVSVVVTSENSTCNSSNGAVKISVVGGVTPYTYTLIYPDGTQNVVSNSQTTQLYSGLNSGTYTAIVEDSSNCSYMQEITVLAENKYTISTVVTPTSCGQINGKIQITATTGATLPLTYSVDGVFVIQNSALNQVTFSNIPSGTHVITVTDASGCVQTSNVYIPSSQPLNYTLYSTSCGTGNNGTITAFIATGNPPFTFNWSNNVLGNPQQIQVSGLTAGTYNLIITDNDGCSQQRTTTINCNTNYVSYQTYVMGSELFNINSPVKYGLLQMLNEGYADLTSGNTNCNLISATFSIDLSVQPAGLSASSTFYTSTSLNNAPTDNLYYDTLKQLMLSIPGIGNVTINQLDNQITIQTNASGTSLNGQEIVVDLVIIYDTMCLT
jgi:large repetitive protein